MTRTCQRAKSLTASTSYASKLLHYLNQMLRLQKPLLLLKKHVEYAYKQYEPKNQLKGCSNKLEEVSKSSAYVKRVGHGGKPD
jgi:hypothetical protein